MAAQRPRLSVLTLFDPLSSSSASPDSDKENDCGDSSFFHLSKQVYSPVHRLRRRLIDIGDMTVEEPDIRDLIEEELEAEINQTVTLEEDENATLTFRDMAKAATPKWSGKHAGRKGTSNTASTPRTPLAEIVTRDEITPVGRKKLFKRPPASAASPLNLIHRAVPTLVIHDVDNISGNLPLATSVPVPVILGGDNEATKKCISHMGASTATLELPTPSDTLLSDTPMPLFLSSCSTEPNLASRAPSPLTESSLRPNAHVSQSSNRHSVDLHSSFQLHLSSSETTFDLLNDKISFLSSKNSLESFLDHEGVSFCDDQDSGTMNHELSSEMVLDEQRMGYPEKELNIRKLDLSETTLEEHVNDPALRNIIGDRHASFHGRNGIPTPPKGKKSSNALEIKCIPDTSPSEAESGVLSTPSPVHPPRPVPALRIVKRTKAPEQAKVMERNHRDSRSTARGRTSKISASHAPERTSLGDTSFVLTGDGITNGGQAKGTSRSAAGDEQAAGGPRRVLVTEVRKVRDIAQAKSVNGIDGPRRVQASETKAKPRAMPMSKQPGKYASTAVSGIPKPVRNPGSRIPAPLSGKRVQIETGKGFLSRRLAGK